MTVTKVFMSGNSQAVRLPKGFQFDEDEVEIFRRGEEIVLRKKGHTLTDFYSQLTSLSEDFMEKGRKQPPLEQREQL